MVIHDARAAIVDEEVLVGTMTGGIAGALVGLVLGLVLLRLGGPTDADRALEMLAILMAPGGAGVGVAWGGIRERRHGEARAIHGVGTSDSGLVRLGVDVR